jgi:hypothetical protein
MALRRKSFDDWTAEDIRDTFHIVQAPQMAYLNEWLANVHAPNAQQIAFLESKRALLERFYRTWNEDELKFRFISQVVELTELIGKGYNTFTQRQLSAVVKTVLLLLREKIRLKNRIFLFTNTSRRANRKTR